MSKRMLAMVLCVAVLGVCVAPAWAEDDVKAAKKVMADYGRAVVRVEGVLTITIDGPVAAPDQERKIDIVGTVVDPSGLTVVSLTTLDPTAAVGKVNARVNGQTVAMSIKGEVSDAKLRLADGTEVPARVVLKDEDLDLAFLAPKDPLDDTAKEAMQSVDLDKAAGKAEALARTISLGRLSKALNRELRITLGRVTSVITKPRTFYIVSNPQPGAPVFDTAGSLVGVTVFRKKSGGAGARGGSISLNVGGTPVTLPTADVKKGAKQAIEEMNKKPDDEASDDDAS
jgi:hypothetical protein